MSDTSCTNYGFANGTSCACPVGFGGPDCSQPACDGNIFQGANRTLVPRPTAPNTFANLTAAGCTCEDGWSGTGCNVCRSSEACQAGYSSVVHQGVGPSPGLSDGQNHTLVCNTAPRVYAAGQMNCLVNSATLQAIYPLMSTINIMRTVNPAMTPLANVTGSSKSDSLFAQIFYDGEEQFYCTADTCAQSLGGNGTQSADWSCQNLQCVCIHDSTFCGAVPLTDLSSTLNSLTGGVDISCDAPAADGTAACEFKQDTILKVFGPNGLVLTGCTFGECVSQVVIDTSSTNTTSTQATDSRASLSGGVIAGLAVVGGLIGIALFFLFIGWIRQRKAKHSGLDRWASKAGGVKIAWSNVSYFVPFNHTGSLFSRKGKSMSEAKTILDDVSGLVEPGHMMAIMGPSGAGKTTLIEILAGKNKVGRTTGDIAFSTSSAGSREATVGFVPQQDILPPTLTVFEAILFAARLRLPENVPKSEQITLVDDVIEKLGLNEVRNVRIGDVEKRGLSGGEMRRVSIGLELIARPDVLILDEPTSGLDSVSAARVGRILHSLAHDPENPTVVVVSIHQPSSQLYQVFDQVLLLSHGRALYSGPGGIAPATHFSGQGIAYQQGYNVADYLLEIASDPPVTLFNAAKRSSDQVATGSQTTENNAIETEKGEKGYGSPSLPYSSATTRNANQCATTFLTQLEVLSGREWKILRRDYTLFLAHVASACVLGVFVGGLYYQTDITIAGFQSRVGCLFFLGSLVAFSALSALFNIAANRPLFLRERSSSYYSPTAWLLSRFIFDVVPLRIIPTILVATITYWMAGLAHDAAHFFKFVFILVLYTLAMTLFNFFLGCVFTNGGIAILLSALLVLYQMTYAGFFAHLSSIPPVLRWLQWLCPLKYALEALAVNEVGSGLQIQDTLEGVPVDVSASLIMTLLFGFGANNYYRDVLVLFAFIAGSGIGVILVVWFMMRERR